MVESPPPQPDDGELGEERVAAAARAAGLSGGARYVASTGSTNHDLMAAAEGGAPAWSVLAAGHQGAGRGRLGRVWVAPPESSLLVSVLLRPSAPPPRVALVSLAAAVAAAEALRETGVDARCRWPNDLVAGAGRRKIAGILPESKTAGGAVRHVVVGLGINVHQSEAEFPRELRGSATSVAIEGGRPDTGVLLRRYLAELRRRSDPDAPGFEERTLAAYRDLCDTIGRPVRAATTDGRAVEGTAVGIGDAGELLVRPGIGEAVPVGLGEVERLR